MDPAPPCADASVAELRLQLLNTDADLFDRYRALFALRNKGDEESVMVSFIVIFCKQSINAMA